MFLSTQQIGETFADYQKLFLYTIMRIILKSEINNGKVEVLNIKSILLHKTVCQNYFQPFLDSGLA